MIPSSDDEGAGLAAEICAEATVSAFSTLFKRWDLDELRIACDGGAKG